MVRCQRRGRIRDLPRRPSTCTPAHVAESLVHRDEVVALLFNVSDIVAVLERIERLLEDDGEAEEADAG